MFSYYSTSLPDGVGCLRLCSQGPLVEVALVWVLFSDAARVPLRDLRADAGRCIRLLALGLVCCWLPGRKAACAAASSGPR